MTIGICSAFDCFFPPHNSIGKELKSWNLDSGKATLARWQLASIFLYLRHKTKTLLMIIIIDKDERKEKFCFELNLTFHSTHTGNSNWSQNIHHPSLQTFKMMMHQSKLLWKTVAHTTHTSESCIECIFKQFKRWIAKLNGLHGKIKLHCLPKNSSWNQLIFYLFLNLRISASINSKNFIVGGMCTFITDSSSASMISSSWKLPNDGCMSAAPHGRATV